MRSQKGSVTVIALIMLLFLVIVGGAWTIMMTQEKTNAFADEKQQQAWYAAEAGYKRAAILLTRSKTEWVNNNTDWSWTTYDATKFKSKNESDLTKISLTDGSVITDATKLKTQPWYAVNIAEITADTYARPTSGTTTYTITSIGEYMGERKVISREVTTKITGGSGGGSLLDKDTIAKAGGNVTVEWATFDATSGATGPNAIKVIGSGSSITRPDSGWNPLDNGYNTRYGYTYIQSTDTMYTKVPDSAFLQSTYSIVDKNPVFRAPGANGKVLELTKNTYVDWPFKWISYYMNGNTEVENGSGDYGYIIKGDSGVVLYIHVPDGTSTLYLSNGIQGPTSGVPFTIVFDKSINIETPISGRVLILGKGDIGLVTNNGSFTGELMLLANGTVTISSIVNTAFISSDSNIIGTTNGSNEFYGQLQAAGDINIPSAKYHLDTTVSTDQYFLDIMPKLLAHGS